jgi:hypothetical protein
MPVRKFRSVEEMPGPEPVSSDDARLWQAIAQLLTLSSRLLPRRLPAGVYKSRSPEEANRRREQAELGPRPLP